MKRDIEIAREIQRWLVPRRAPDVHGGDIAFATRPAKTVGGDYYDDFAAPRMARY
jgi:sigma-B regulation protein RsbU (phosphoserine phosphatase)